jgi:hypothetical protein
LIAAYVLRTPDEVAASRDHRELSVWALFAPATSVLTLLGIMYLIWCPPIPDREFLDDDDDDDNEMVPDERMSLLLAPKDLLVNVPTQFHPRTEAYRRHSIALMGIPQITFHENDEAAGISRQSFFV